MQSALAEISEHIEGLTRSTFVEASKIFVNSMTGLRHLSIVAHRCRFLPSRWSFPSCSFRLRQEAGARSSAPSRWSSVSPARRATVPYVIESNGIVTPLQSAAVVPQVDGIIQSVDFQEGQEVRPGQPLFHIDPRPYQNAYDAGARRCWRATARRGATREANAERYEAAARRRR